MDIAMVIGSVGALEKASTTVANTVLRYNCTIRHSKLTEAEFDPKALLWPKSRRHTADAAPKEFRSNF